jgi:hypothetical protein
VTQREFYKVGLYTGEKKGFFRQHRDNFDNPLGYRRVACTVHLNDDYQGGGLRFPEYDENIYRPHAGAAIAFSCATLHEARPVTEGERYILVCFFHGEQDEAYRRHYLTSRNEPIKEKDYAPSLHPFPEFRKSRDFYGKWQKENVTYTKSPGGVITSSPPALAAPSSPKIMINILGKHQAKKVYESKQAVIIDDFLPEDVYEKVPNRMSATWSAGKASGSMCLRRAGFIRTAPAFPCMTTAQASIPEPSSISSTPPGAPTGAVCC